MLMGFCRMKLPPTAPFSDQQRSAISAALGSLSSEQSQWLSGFLAGAQIAGGAAPATAAPATNGQSPLTILFGTESGNAESLAREAQKQASGKGYQVTLKDMGDIKADALGQLQNLLVIVSTWGEGDPPDRAVTFYEELMGDSAPKLTGLRFSVLSLGDSSYEHFCKIGKDVDTRLETLGAKRFHPRVDCDVDFDEPYKKWIDGALTDLSSVVAPVAVEAVSSADASSDASAAAPAIEYGKKNPFPSTLKERILLNGRGSIKETIHLELSLEGSGMTYEAGDALAVIPTNCPEVVDELIAAGGFDSQDAVPMPDGEEGPLKEVLFQYYDITTLTKPVLKKYAALAKSAELDALLTDEAKDQLKEYLWGRDQADMLRDFPVKGLPAKDFVSVLRKMPPRLYSIASSLKAHPDEVHLTIAAVRYEANGRKHKGVCSTFTADRVAVGETMPVYTHTNKNFKLPTAGETPVIMIGPGTGIAPFRAFVEERKALGATGRNWLFFGDQRFTYDFLYQTEWQDYLSDGILTRLDTAFSRDQKHKVYVQHRIIERGKELYAWLEEGAHFYVCGDASRMAHDVNEALISVIEKHGAKSREDAEAYVKELSKSKRYQRDVY